MSGISFSFIEKKNSVMFCNLKKKDLRNLEELDRDEESSEERNNAFSADSINIFAPNFRFAPSQEIRFNDKAPFFKSHTLGVNKAGQSFFDEWPESEDTQSLLNLRPENE